MADSTVKCVVVGDGYVGKTCMLYFFANNTFPENYTLEELFGHYVVTVMVQGEPYSLELFDTSGQEHYDRLRPLSYPNTDVFLVCFSVVDSSSFANVKEKWLPEVGHYCKGKPIVLVGTMTDLREDRTTLEKMAKRKQVPITAEEGRKLAKASKAAAYVECSAQTQRGLKNVFDEALLAAIQPPAEDNRKWYRKLCVIM